MQWLAILFPAALVFTYEAIRHHWMETTHNYWGNLVGAIIVGTTVHGFIRYYIRIVTQAEQELGRSRAEAAVLAERNRIGREMHDSVAQTLFHVRVKLREVRQHTHEPSVTEELVRLEDQVTAAYDQVRTVIADLKKQAETEDNTEALFRAVTETAKGLGLVSTLSVSYLPKLSAQNQAHVQAIVTEALTNASRHGGATGVTITCDSQALRIQDNGRGFDPAQVPPDRFGLMIMEERARMVGGALTIDSAPGAGTTILLHWGAEHDGHPALGRR
jgi:signal transduction histidine kinase